MPPPATLDRAGKPLCSWRVRILPYLVCYGRYHQYDYEKPWNSPHNKAITDDYQGIFRCRADQLAGLPGSKITNYVVLVGTRAAWWRAYGKSLKARNAQDPSPGVFIVVELADSGIEWAEPRDILSDDAGAMAALIAKNPHADQHSYFCNTAGINALLVDGDMCIALDGLQAGSSPPNWPHCVGLPFSLVSVGLLLHQAVRSRKRADHLVVPQER